MNPALDALLRSWPFDPWLLLALSATAAVYARGWWKLHRRMAPRWPAWRLTAFLGGLAAVLLALASPIEPFAGLLLQVHMLQHLLLMMVAPPLLWAGTPLFPLLRGMPRSVRMGWIAPLFRSRVLRAILSRLTQPVWAWLCFVSATWLWHAPPIYELALSSDSWHYLQHACFLGTGLLFWYPVLRPYPSQPAWSHWLLVPYLLLADVQNTALSAVLTFSDRVLYPPYAQVPRISGGSALEDQSIAGVLMWVPGSVAYLLPLFAIGLRLLYGERRTECRVPSIQYRVGNLASSQSPHVERYRFGNGAAVRSRRIELPLVTSVLGTPYSVPSTGFDVLAIPLLGSFLRWRHARLIAQLPLFVLAGLMILDGLRGPQIGAMNLAGVLPWIHWRGLLIIGLLVAGNCFCFACPFLLPRTLARTILPAGRSWPRWLRSKWLAVACLLLFLWSYEAFSLWDRPWTTAWIAIGYFTAAFAVDGWFRGAAFCKYLCPIGQFNFVQSLVSPLEIKVRNPQRCDSCATKDCIRGRGSIPGCELDLFLPRKAGNMDCTFCLDCVHACPHDNVGLLATAPGRELWHDRVRSGVGRFARRPDVAALIVVLTFGAFANAAGMVGPVQAWRDEVAVPPLVATTFFYLVALVALPLLLVGLAAVVSRRWAGHTESWWTVATRFSYCLVPLGFAMWLAHYSFHFVTGYETAVPATQRFVADHLGALLGQARWECSCCRPVTDGLLRAEILALDVGLLLSLYTAYRLSQPERRPWSQVVSAFVPWALLLLLLFGAGIWLVFQPMEMRGTLPS